MDQAKVALSAEELRLVTDPSVIFMKNSIISKVYALFGNLSATDTCRLEWPREVSGIPPKIARGEAYKGLPYVMLDFPRYFTATDVFALRTFFWWGRYVSVTLHLKGMYKGRFQQVLLNESSCLITDEVYVAFGGDEWDHDLEGGGYRILRELSASDKDACIRQGSFLKISCFLPLEQWGILQEWLCRTHRQFGELIGS